MTVPDWEELRSAAVWVSDFSILCVVGGIPRPRYNEFAVSSGLILYRAHLELPPDFFQSLWKIADQGNGDGDETIPICFDEYSVV